MSTRRFCGHMPSQGRHKVLKAGSSANRQLAAAESAVEVSTKRSAERLAVVGRAPERRRL